MGTGTQFLAHLCTMTVILFTVLLLRITFLLRSAARSLWTTNNRPITATRYLELIDQKNPAVRFAKGLSVDAAECGVCLAVLEEGEEIRRLKCNHTFHRSCVDKWLQQDRATCPLCRTKVLPEEIVVRYRQRLSHHEHDGSDEELIFLLSALHAYNLHRLL